MSILLLASPNLSLFVDWHHPRNVQFLGMMYNTSRYLKKAFTLYTSVYLLALLIAVAVGYFSRGLNPVLFVFLADIAATLVIYSAGRIFHNASFYDAYWSVAPPVIALFWTLITLHKYGISLWHIIVLILVFAWGIRLTYNWTRQWQGLQHEDWRYRDLRIKTGRWFWFVELIGIDLMPTIIVFLACLPLYPALAAGSKSLGFLDVIGVIITAGAIVIETVADRQLRQFTRQKKRQDEIMKRGLWAFSRHPNYFGEIMFWWGIFIFGLAADLHYWWTIIGALSVTLLFTCISIPLMEKRSLARRPEYTRIIKKIPVLFPWFPKTN
jgi:steroid 5-alpha reductase family enzyme